MLIYVHTTKDKNKSDAAHPIICQSLSLLFHNIQPISADLHYSYVNW